jgi:hypothetical protein
VSSLKIVSDMPAVTKSKTSRQNQQKKLKNPEKLCEDAIASKLRAFWPGELIKESHMFCIRNSTDIVSFFLSVFSLSTI